MAQEDGTIGPSIVIADDHYPTRERLRARLAGAGFRVTASVGDAAAAVAAAREARPDLCLLDINMPGGGVAATAGVAACSPATVIVILTVSRDDHDLFDAVQAGASGYILKDTPLEAIPGLLERALDGEAPLSAQLAARVLEEIRERGRRHRILAGRDTQAELSRREWQVLELLAEHLTSAEIAERLFIEPATVRSHVAAVLRKLQVPSRQAAVRLLQAKDHRQYPW